MVFHKKSECNAKENISTCILKANVGETSCSMVDIFHAILSNPLTSPVRN